MAVTCPGCHGLEEVAPGLYTEPDLPPDRRRRAIEIVEAAGRRVHDFYGGRESAPRVLVCATDDCYRRIGGGGERGIAILNRAVMLSPRGANEVIAAHELSHVELDSRIGPGRVPRWFDEGLAVVVSGDPRYLAPETTPGQPRRRIRRRIRRRPRTGAWPNPESPFPGIRRDGRARPPTVSGSTPTPPAG
nr:hypothetical protein GCM10020093_071020 [Planobispora longispora]